MHDPGQHIADALATFLNEQPFSFEFDASAPENPQTELNLDGTGKVHKGLRVFVVPVSELEERLDRGGAVAVRPTVNVFISRFLEVKGVTRKELGDFVREIMVALRFNDVDDWTWERTETISKYDPNQLVTQARFLSVLGVSFYDIE